MSAQLFLFGARGKPQGSPLGVKVHLHVPCPKCGNRVGMIGHGAGPHPAELRCARCIAHSRWLSERERQIAIRVSSSPHAPDVILLPPLGGTGD
jgi:hypothetical protein